MPLCLIYLVVQKIKLWKVLINQKNEGLNYQDRIYCPWNWLKRCKLSREDFKLKQIGKTFSLVKIISNVIYNNNTVNFKQYLMCVNPYIGMK